MSSLFIEIYRCDIITEYNSVVLMTCIIIVYCVADRRETLQMHSMRSGLYPKGQPQATLQNPFRRKAFPVPGMLIQVQTQGCTQRPHEDSFR